MFPTALSLINCPSFTGDINRRYLRSSDQNISHSGYLNLFDDLRGESSTVSHPASLLEQMGHFFLPLELGWHEQTVKHLVTRPLSLSWPIRKLEQIALLMMQFDWLIALGLVKSERLMKQFDWVKL